MNKKCGFVAIIGPPNAGKSTLSNALVGQKVAIVTQKAQTTRMRLRAVVMHQEAQIILVDTPGIFAAKQRFDRAMVNEAWMGGEDADEVLVVLDAARATPASHAPRMHRGSAVGPSHQDHHYRPRLSLRPAAFLLVVILAKDLVR